MALNDRERKLCAAIARRGEELYAQLERYVAIPTGGGYRPGLDEYRALLLERLQALGGQVEMIPGQPRPSWLALPSAGNWRPRNSANGDSGEDRAADEPEPLPTALVRRERGGGSPRVLLASHLDTVHDPNGPFQKLRKIDERFATGPGAVDMKGGTVLAIAALEALEEHGVLLSWSYIFNSDEETGSFQSDQALREAARGHDFGIATEPALADGSLAVERMGSGSFKIEAFGRSAHVGRSFTEGVSAVNALAEALLKIREMARPEEGRIISVGPLVGGTVVNAVPEYAAAWGNVRYANAEAGRALGEELDALQTPAEDGREALPRVVVHRAFNRPAKPLTPDVEALALRARGAAEDLGQTLPFAKTGGVCDGNNLQAAGLPTIDTLGIRGGHLHRPDEFIEISSLVERAQLMAVLLARIARGD